MVFLSFLSFLFKYLFNYSENQKLFFAFESILVIGSKIFNGLKNRENRNMQFKIFKVVNVVKMWNIFFGFSQILWKPLGKWKIILFFFEFEHDSNFNKEVFLSFCQL